ncbi:MAG: hypothetical protein K9L62_10625 [Vallitaleaceae bacterium]|nr:hypothetical protein [Vallitaleaceae bacterium]
MKSRTFGVHCEKPQLITDTVNYAAPYRRVNIRTIDRKTIWSLLKEYINSLEDNEQFTRKDLLYAVYVEDAAKALTRVETSVDQYRRYITILGFLDHPGRGTYKKIKDLPPFLTVSKAKRAAYDRSWRSWFMQIEDF